MKICNFRLLILILLVFNAIKLFQSNDIDFENVLGEKQSQGCDSYFPLQILSFIQFADHDPIAIDGNAEFINQADNEEWRGAGTASNPYIIDGFIFSSSGSGDLIRIFNTDLYFRVNNCLIIGGFRGIFLSNVKNCTIANNTIFNGSGPGISQISSNSNTIVNNTISNNNWSGISLFTSANNTLSSNTISNNSNGIYLSSSANNTLSSNTISNNSNGIYLFSSANNTLASNIISNNSNGIYLSSSGNSTIFNNRISYNNGFGIFLSSSGDGTITNNTISNNNWSGISLSSSANNILASNTISNNSNGISLSSSANNTLASNIISDNSNGIYLIDSENNIIANNTVSNNSNGISLSSSGNSTIFNNRISYNNGFGIFLSSSGDDTITNNTISNNNWSGISLSSSANNTLASNSIYNNSNGISLFSSANNTLASNSIYNNRWHGIHLDSSTHSTIINNTISYNRWHGIHLDSSTHSTIINNTISYNSNGIYIVSSENSTTINNRISYNRFGIFLSNSDNYFISNNTINNNSNGIFLTSSDHGLILSNTIFNNRGSGIHLNSSNNITITNNTISNNRGQGIILSSSVANTFTNNTISNNSKQGIYLSSSYGITISNNLVYNNNYGLQLFFSSNNTLSKNIIFNNTDYGIYFSSSGNNTVSDNYLIDYSLFLSGSQPGHFLQAAVTNNSVNGNPLVYWDNFTNGTVPSGAGQIILVNCTSVTVTGQNLERVSVGVFAAFSTNLSIHNNVLSYNNRYGIYLFTSANSTISNNLLFDNDVGIGLHNSGNNTIVSNKMTDNGLFVFGDDLRYYIQEKVSNNTINGKTLIYWQNVTDRTVPEGTAQVILINCKDVKVIGQNLANVNIGIFAIQVTNLDIRENIISDNHEGIRFINSNNSFIIRNIIKNCNNGIFLQSSHRNTIEQNLISYNNLSGLVLVKSNFNFISANYILSNSINGIDLWISHANSISKNLISYNNKYGIYLNISGWNRVEWNDFIGNSPHGVSQAYDQGSKHSQNLFDSNYWDDWTTPDVDVDGIVDYHYSINGTSINYDQNPTNVSYLIESFVLSKPTVIFPNGREDLGGIITIQWNVSSGILSYDIFYNVYYSFDGGTSWTMLAGGLTTTYYIWNTTTLPDGSSYRIKIIAFDSEGKMSLDISDRSFTINNSYSGMTLLKLLILLNIIMVGAFLFIISCSTSKDIYNLNKTKSMSRDSFFDYFQNDLMNSVKRGKWVILAICGAFLLSFMRAWLIDPVVVVADRYDWYAINMKWLLNNWEHEIDRIPIEFLQFRIIYPLLIAILSTLLSFDVILIGRIISIISFSISVFYLSKILERFKTLSQSPNKERILIVSILTPTMITNFVRLETDIFFLALSLYIIHKYMMFVAGELNNLQKANFFIAIGLLLFTREVGIVLILVFLLRKFLSVSQKYKFLILIFSFILYLVSIRIDVLQELLLIFMWNATGYTPAYEIVYNNNFLVVIEIFLERISNPENINRIIEPLVLAFFPSVIFCFLGFIRLYRNENRVNRKKIMTNITTLYFITFCTFFIFFKIGGRLDRFWIPVLLFPLLFLPFTVDLEELIHDFQKLINEIFKWIYFKIFQRLKEAPPSHVSFSFFNMIKNTFNLNDKTKLIFPKSTFYFIVIIQILFYVIRLILSLITAGVLPVYQ